VPVWTRPGRLIVTGATSDTVTEGSGLGVGEPKKTQDQGNLENARIGEDY
jgi:hypothetical protein